MVKIAFWDNCLCERGTTISTLQYAYYNIHILNNESVVLFNETRPENDWEVIHKIPTEIPVYGVPHFTDIQPLLKKLNCDILYITKGGIEYTQVIPGIKNVIHCVFDCRMPHGDVYASISPYVKNNNGRFPVVPYMVDFPEHSRNMRQTLGIPEEAVVFGRHGGKDTFDITYAQRIVHKVAKENPTIYFVFVNTNVFCEKLPNIIHLEKIIDLEKKREFINTCDAMIHARTHGESFGLSIAEFSISNKPVFSAQYIDKMDTAHFNFLKETGFWYNENTLYDMLVTFDKKQVENKDWNVYRDYTPTRVMKIFDKVFIQST